jgi:hypothetical protein
MFDLKRITGFLAWPHPFTPKYVIRVVGDAENNRSCSPSAIFAIEKMPAEKKRHDFSDPRRAAWDIIPIISEFAR